MRIAMMTNNYKPFVGGVPISIERLVNSLEKKGHEVFIFAPQYKQHENIGKEQNVIRYKSSKVEVGGFIIPNIIDKNIYKQFKQLNIDVIHTHHPILMGNTALHLGKKYNIPVIFTYHTRYEEYVCDFKFVEIMGNIRFHNLGIKIIDTLKYKAIPHYIKHFTDKCSVVVAPTDLIKENLLSNGVDTSIEVIPTGLTDKNFFIDDKKVSEINKKYRGNKKYLFCTVARLSQEKNIPFLINSIKGLKEKSGNCFSLIIIGDGVIKIKLQQMVNVMNLKENIIFLGDIPNEELSHYYKASDLFLFSSKSETQGMVLTEAMAQSTPVVAIKASGVVDVVKNGYNGFMCEDNINSFNERILDILDNNEIFQKLKCGAYLTSLSYNSSKIASRFELCYEKALKKEVYCQSNNKMNRFAARWKNV